MSVYPGSLDSFVAKVAHVDLYRAAHMNDVQAAIVALETELGTDPAGSAADLKARLAVRIADDGMLKQPQQLVTVGHTNADYATIQAAIDSIDDAASDKIYTVLIAPGEYHEIVELTPYINLVGLDRNACHVYSAMEGEEPYRDYVINLADNNALANLYIESTSSDGDEKAVRWNEDEGIFIHNCTIRGRNTAINIYNGSGVVDLCDTTRGKIVVQGTGTVELHSMHIVNEGAIALQTYGETIKVRNCSIKCTAAYGGTITCVGATIDLEITNSYVEHTGAFAVQTHSGSFKAKNSTFKGGGNNAAFQSQPACALSLLLCTILKHGSATVSVLAVDPLDASIALCALNAALHADVTNLITTPYNVVDSDVS